MSEDQLVNRHVFSVLGAQSTNSFGDPSARPPTPKQSPTSAAFPSSIFETPRPPQGSFTESSGQTPRYAEDYSVFNATPGNLRGNQRSFADFISTDFIGPPLGHKRLLSTEDISIEIASRVNLASPHPCFRFPGIDPSRRLPSSPAFVFPKGPSMEAELQPSPHLPSHAKSSKKLRRGTLTLPSSEATQVLSPPPSAHKGDSKPTQKPENMQDDQQNGQSDFESLQADEVVDLMGNAGDVFSYGMAANGGTHSIFWDSTTMNMEIDFGASPTTFFQPSHRHTGSFDWNSDIQLFVDPVPAAPDPTTTLETPLPIRRERALAPKPSASAQATPDATATLAASALPAPPSNSTDDTFRLAMPAEGVNPGLIYSRPNTSSMDVEFKKEDPEHPIATSTVGGNHNHSTGLSQPRRANSTTGAKETKKGKMVDRPLARPSGKTAPRPGIERSLSEGKGKKGPGRPLPVLAPAIKTLPPAGSPGVDDDKSESKSSRRASPVRSQRRLSSLASIPESLSQPHLGRPPRTSVRFTIDAHGRARAETTFVLDDASAPSMTRSRSSRELSGRSSWDSSDDESSADDEPIIIPGRSNSQASFTLPDARNPISSMFHSSRHSVSERSTTTSSGTRDGSAGPLCDNESETDTIFTENERGGDAASELRKLVQDRQKRALQTNTVQSGQSLAGSNLSGSSGSTISPVSVADSTYGTDGQTMRCVCRGKNDVDKAREFMLQCESCEMWLHGRCVNISRFAMPSVYICGFCAIAGSMAGRRLPDTDLATMAARASVLLPVKERLMRAFRGI